MKNISPLNIAASIAVLTVLAISLILVKETFWSIATIATAIGFASSVGFIFYVPSVLRQKQKNTDSIQMAALGPLGAISIFLLISTGGGFILALAGYQQIGLAMLVFGIGAFFVMNLVLNAALKVVDEVSTKYSQPSHHIDWQNQVSVLSLQATHKESLSGLRVLLENLRYSASDVLGGSPQDAGIEKILNSILEQLQSDPEADLASQLSSINGLLAQRDIYLRSARSKA